MNQNVDNQIGGWEPVTDNQQMREALTCNIITRDAVRQAIVDGFNTLYASDMLFEDAVERCHAALSQPAASAEVVERVKQLYDIAKNSESTGSFKIAEWELVATEALAALSTLPAQALTMGEDNFELIKCIKANVEVAQINVEQAERIQQLESSHTTWKEVARDGTAQVFALRERVQQLEAELRGAVRYLEGIAKDNKEIDPEINPDQIVAEELKVALQKDAGGM